MSIYAKITLGIEFGVIFHTLLKTIEEINDRSVLRQSILVEVTYIVHILLEITEKDRKTKQ
jgi:hypothetical protein